MTTMAIDNKEKEVLNVPHLRFPEFSGEWKKHSLGEIGETIIGLTYKPSDVVDNNGIIVFRSSNIKNGMIDYSDLVRVNKYIKDKIITKENDILVCARNGSQRLIGKNAIIKQEDANNTFGAFMMVYRANDNPFILPLLSTNKYFSQVGENLGARINQITTSDFNGFEFYFPENHAERTKIAELFRLLDERIATQNKIIEKLQSLIKGLSQQLLSSENDWILYRLDDLAQIKSGYSGTQVSYQTPYKVSRIETISKHCIDIQRIGYVECIPESYRLNVGNILFSNINSIQYIGNTAYLDKDYGLYHGMNLLRIIPNTTIVRPRFLHLLLCTDWAINHFQTICNKAVSQASINQTALGKSRFPIPPMSVQQQICSMFELTERKLDNEQEYISCLQQQKRYLLQKMFI